MSEYAYIEGKIQYKTKADFDKAIKVLTDGKWLHENQWVDAEGDEIVISSKPDYENFIIWIPYHYHRNLNRVLDRITKNTKGMVIATTIDGYWHAKVYENGLKTIYDLKKWAVDNDLPLAKDATEAERYEWQNKVEREFFEEHSEAMNWS